MIESRRVYRRFSRETTVFRVWSLTRASQEEIEVLISRGLPLSQAAWIYKEQLPTLVEAAYKHGFYISQEQRVPWGQWMVLSRATYNWADSNIFPMWIFDTGSTCNFCEEEIFSIAQCARESADDDCMPMCEHHLNIWLLEGQMKGEGGQVLNRDDA